MLNAVFPNSSKRINNRGGKVTTHINDASVLKSKFSNVQLEQIAAVKTPAGYTWHHNEEVGKMQLVIYSTHDSTKHTGGRALWGGGQEAR